MKVYPRASMPVLVELAFNLSTASLEGRAFGHAGQRQRSGAILERRRAGAQPLMIIEIPSSPVDSVERVLRALPEAAKAGARVVCFPEAYVPGYPWGERRPANVDANFLDDAHAKIAKAAAQSGIGVVL
jgi:hypothetical protein